jgi:hypothetical protein
MSLRNSLEEMQKKVTFPLKEEVSPRFEASSTVKAFDCGPVLFSIGLKTTKQRSLKSSKG